MATIIASDATNTVDGGSANDALTVSVTSNGMPVTPDSINITGAAQNGTATAVGGSILYTPNAGYYGTDSVTYTATVGVDTSNAATISINVLAEDCTDIGRTTRLLATAYNLSRPQVVKARRYAKRCFVVDFTGALDPSANITNARWDCSGPWAAYMSNVRIINGQKKTAVDVEFNFAGWSWMLCTVTTDGGESYNSEFIVTVTDAPLYPRAVYNTANGPFYLIASL